MAGTPGGRAFRGLALVFVLTFVNLTGVIVTAAALGGVAPWTRWQFIGLYGVLEVANGLANVIAPNLWRLPVAELQTERRTNVRLAASTVLLPHWGGLARAAAGLVLVVAAASQEGVAWSSLALVPFIAALALAVLAASALVARAGVARPDLDVVQFTIRWGGRERQPAPVSLGASVLQFLLAIATIPIAKLLAPSILYQPALAPSASAFVAVLAGSLLLAVATAAAWAGRMTLTAPVEQQREADRFA
jgi:hypothetical protein